jgi:hypothetical protein
MKADYLPWNRFPFRDPSERIAKVFNINRYNYVGRPRLLKDAFND